MEHIACCKRPSNWASNFFSIMKPPFAQRVAGSLLGEHFWKTLCHLSHRFTKVEVCLARRSIGGVMAGGPLRPRGARWGPPSSSQLPWPTFLTLSYTAKLEKPYATPAVARSFFYSCFAESYLKKPYNAHKHTRLLFWRLEGVCRKLSVLFFCSCDEANVSSPQSCVRSTRCVGLCKTHPGSRKCFTPR